MLTNEDFLAFLNDRSFVGSFEEQLAKIIDEELEKPESEMNTELIEYCLDKLNEHNNKTERTEETKINTDFNGKRIKFNLKRLIAVAAVICIFAVAAVVYENRQPTVSYIVGNYAIDINDPAQVVGSKDYVFVCEVLEVKDCNTQLSEDELPDLITEADTPMTRCVVKVLKNIKGNLKAGETVTFYKDCGLSRNGRVFHIYENDLMPQKDNIYIFTGYGQYDGTLTGGGENGTIWVCNSGEKYEETEVYKEYVEYVKNQVAPPIEYPHYLAYADVNFGDGSINKKIYEEFN